MSTNVAQSLWLAALTLLAFAAFLALSPSDPGAPAVMFDRDGNAYTQQGEPIDCTVDTRC